MKNLKVHIRITMTFTLDNLKERSPGRMKKLINKTVVDVLNQIEDQDGSEFSEAYRERFISHSQILDNPEYTMTAYINAVKFVSYRMMQYNVIDSYMIAFPDRYGRLLEKYADLGDENWIRQNKIGSFASEYNTGKLVNEIMAQSLIPPSILNLDLFQEALNVEAVLMRTARSETVRQLAAKTVLEILKPEEIKKIELDIGVKENTAITDLRKATLALATGQQGYIASGAASALEIAECSIIEVEPEEQ